MKKLKFTFLYTVAFLKRKSGFISLILIALVALLLGFRSVSGSVNQSPKISEGIVGSYTESNLPDVVTKLLSRGLFKIDDTGAPALDLAKDWSVSSDGTVYTIHLKDNLKWSDGSPINAQDMDLRIADVQTFVGDDHTLQFKINEAFSPFLTLLDKPLFRKNSWVGMGPYTISHITTDPTNSTIQKIDLLSNDHSLPDITIHFYPSAEIAQEAIRLGDVQSLLDVEQDTTLSNSPNLTSWSKTDYGRLVTIFYNTKDKTLANENLRLGLSFAAPSITGQTKAVTSIPPTNWAFTSDVKQYLDNPTAAKAEFAKIPNLSGDQVTLTVTSSLQDVGKQVVDAWKKQGVNAQMEVESGIPQSFQSLLIEHDIPLDPDQYALWHSTQTDTNLSQFSHPRVDKDLEDGRKATDSATRKAKYQDFQKTLMEHAPATFLYFPKFNVVYMKKIDLLIKKVLPLQAP